MSRTVKISAALGGAALLIVALAVGFAIASIGGDDDTASSEGGGRSGRQFPGAGAPGGARPSGADRAALEAFQDCLAKHGVELPQPPAQGGQPPSGGQPPMGGQPPSGFDPSDPELQNAFAACQDELPEGFGPG